MKVIVWGCSHIGKTLAGYDWRKEFDVAVNEVVTRAASADLVVHLGDLFDCGRPRPRDYTLALEVIEAIAKPMFILKGNHDENPGLEPDALDPLMHFRFHEEVKIVTRPTMIGAMGRFFVFIPHQNDAKERGRSGGRQSAQQAADDVVAGCFEGRVKISALFTHVDLAGAGHPVEESSHRVNVALDLEELQKMPFDVVAGHYHKSAHHTPNVYVHGSLLPFDFGEVGNQKFILTMDL
jgi:DNA repair exonuclease SbcCD nuclease subunit